MKDIKEARVLFIFCFINALFLLHSISNLSISYYEAQIYFSSKGILHYLTNFSTFLFGENDYALRLPILIFHFLNVILLYKISKSFLKRKVDRLVSSTIYLLLPGVAVSAVIVNNAVLSIFLTLLFIFLEQKKHELSYLVLISSVFIDNSFFILYFSLFFYAIVKKDRKLLYLSLFLFGISMYFYGHDIHGKPKSYFLATLGVYAASITPLIFLYMLYALYRILIKEEKNLLWYISFISLVFTLVISHRQKLLLEDFLPFVVIAIPLCVQIFFKSYRIRLPQFRIWHKRFMVLVMFFLVLNFLLAIFNEHLYYIQKRTKKHFAYNYQVVKELSSCLKQKNINKINTSSEKLALRLRFYGINKGGNKKLYEAINTDKIGDFCEIYYSDTLVVRYKITFL